MATWKVLFIGVCATLCLALGLACIVVPLSQTGGYGWGWLGGLVAATLFAGWLFSLFLRYASGSLDVKPRRAVR